MTKKKKISMISMDLDDPEAAEQIARELGVKPEVVKDTIMFSMGIHDEIRDQDLSFNQCIAGLMSVVADLLRHNVPTVERAEVCTNIYHNLWGASGLPSDREFKELKYTFSKESIN
jgi:predicted RecB family endonuclease